MRRAGLASLALLAALGCRGPARDVQMNRADDLGRQGNSTIQSETSHAVTARGIVAAWNDSRQFAELGALYRSVVGWRYSADGGASFQGGGLFTLEGHNTITDPAMAADSAGFFYLAAIVSGSLDTRERKNLAVVRSTGNRPPFYFDLAHPQILEPIDSTGELDKGLMAIDRQGGPGADRLYLTATELDTRERVVFTRTRPGNPRTFQPLSYLSPLNPPATGSMLAIGPQREVYVLWTVKGRTLPRQDKLQIVKSTDFGEHFFNPDPAEPPGSVKTLATFPATGFVPLGRRQIRNLPFAQIAVDTTAAGSPTRGFVYVVFTANPPEPPGVEPDDTDVFFTRSTDGGAHWSGPQSITSGPAVTLGRDPTRRDNWMPAIAVSPVTGAIHVSFYDRRSDPGDTETRFFHALSTDGGLTWANAQLGSETFVPVTGFLDGSGGEDYWGDYNWITADWTGTSFTWGDSRNRCQPPRGAPSPCREAGRPDVDTYFRHTPPLLGPDLFAQPWGTVTGLGPPWQTPDLFVVDTAGKVAGVQEGVVNLLRARVRNLGARPARGAVAHFRAAGWFAGGGRSPWREIGIVPLDLSAAGSGRDTQIVAIDWDLRAPPDRAAQGFCAQLSLELADDANLSNNVAESCWLNGEVVTELEPGLAPATAEYWRVSPPRPPPEHPSTVVPEPPLPPPWTVPAGAKERRLLAGGSREVFRVIAGMLGQLLEGPSVANRERGLINSQAVRRTAEELRQRVAAEDLEKVSGDGYSILSFYLQPRGDGVTEVGAVALLAVIEEEEESPPGGLVLRSNGSLERSYLEALASPLGEVR